MSTEEDVGKILQAFNEGDWRLCLTRAAPLLTEGHAPASVILVAAQSYARLGHRSEAAHFYEMARRTDARSGPVSVHIGRPHPRPAL